jgi:hypothetical protein
MTILTNIEDGNPSPAALAELAVLKQQNAPAIHDPDRFLRQAKQIVVDNYNAHRSDRRPAAALTLDTVYIVSFTKTKSEWQAVVASPHARGRLWVASYSKIKREVLLEIYKKINDVHIPDAPVVK